MLISYINVREDVKEDTVSGEARIKNIADIFYSSLKIRQDPETDIPSCMYLINDCGF